LDSNAFLTPALNYYAFDICGSYWGWIASAAKAGTVKSISPVKRELRQKDDQVRNWIDIYSTDLFIPDDAAVSEPMTNISTWVSSQDYTSAAVSEFLSKADSYLVAYALLRNYQIVTLETSEPHRKSKVKIPDACKAFGIGTLTPYQMLRNHGVKF
jgi:hypothetical protein